MNVIESYIKKKYFKSTTQNAIKAYQIKKHYVESHEVYSIKQHLESMRCNTTVDYNVELHTNVNKDNNTLGESKAEFQLVKNEWRNFIDHAVEISSYIQNPYYEYSPPGEYKIQENILYDNAFSNDLKNQVLYINESLEELQSIDIYNCYLVSFEVFLKKIHTKIKNHKGVDVSYPSSKILFDYVLHSPNKEHEINGLYERRLLHQVPFTQILKEEARSLLDLEKAVLPETGTFSVIMTDQALDTMYDYFIQHANAHSLYHKYSQFSINKSVYSREPKEKITIQTDPYLPGGWLSGFIDATSHSLKPVTIIQDGVLVNFLIDGKYSYYLNKKRTSAMTNIVVQAGNHTYDSFISDGVLELAKFSTFSPNPITGSFSGEIRLGYLYKNGEKIPIKGGSVSGITQDAFLKCYLSKETTHRGAYLGPKYIFFEELTIAGK